MSPKIVDVEEKKKGIIQAAIGIIARRGLAQTKMEDIAQAAEIGKGTLYEYFKSKDEIFQGAFYRVMALFSAESIRELSEVKSAREEIEEVFSLMGRIHLSDIPFEHYQIFIDFWMEMIKSEEEGRPRLFDFHSYYCEYRVYLVKILQKGMDRGEFERVDAPQVASSLMAFFDGALLQWMMDRENYRFMETLEAFSRLFLRGILAPQGGDNK